MTAGLADSAIETDDLAMLVNLPDGDAAGITDASMADAANAG